MLICDVGKSAVTPTTVSVFDGASNRAFVPTVSINYGWASDTDVAFSNWIGSRVLMTDRSSQTPGWAILATLSWRLPEYWWPNQLEWPKAEMYELQKQVAFIVEDAWMERQLHLSRLAREAVAQPPQNANGCPRGRPRRDIHEHLAVAGKIAIEREQQHPDLHDFTR